MKRSQQGVALLVVLWACTLLAILVGGFASVARTEALQTRFSLGQQRARYAAEAGIMQAIVVAESRRRRSMAEQAEGKPPENDGLPSDGRSLDVVFDRIHVAVGMLDETGKVDVNTSSAKTLRRLFLAAGCSDARAGLLTDNIIAWRGPTILAGDDGAAPPVHMALGGSDRPSYAPFAAIEELQSVKGMDPALYSVIEPVVTVWSGRQIPEADFAPALALATRPDMDLATARQVVAIRDHAPPGAVLTNLPGEVSLGGALPGNTMTFRADADDGHGGRARVEATVLFPGVSPVRDRREPLYTVLRWRDGPSG